MYRTRSMHFASYLIASDSLPFDHVEMCDDSRGAFFFDDKNSQGDKLYLHFNRGAQCGANDLFSAVTFLRKQMDRVKQTGDPADVSSYHRR